MTLLEKYKKEICPYCTHKNKKETSYLLAGVVSLKETTVLNRISKLVENINYKSLYIEIKTNNDRYIIEKEKPRVIGFRKE